MYKRSIEECFREAISLGASDLHISAGHALLLRINGKLAEHESEIFSTVETEDFARQLLNAGQMRKFADCGEVDFSYSLADGIRFRINLYRNLQGISLAVRIIPSVIPSLEEIQAPAVLREWGSRNFGLILVAGPTGSGKSTTLAALVGWMNQTVRKHVITLEDPIEFLHPKGLCLIDQREIGADTASFFSGLRSSLRQDPDVLLIGEMRDPETIAAALSAAETGHLVLSTLHTSGAVRTISRIIGSFAGERQTQVQMQLSDSLLGIVSQRLLNPLQGGKLIPAFEVLVNNPAAANLIRGGKLHQIPSIMQTSSSLGMQTMDTQLKSLYMKQLIGKSDLESILGISE